MGQKQPRRIHVKDAFQVADEAAQKIEGWLLHFEETEEVINVENIAEYQNQDVDLIWRTRNKSFKIEIKGDRWHQTGNFFFETHSNEEKNTPGCFIYTQADYIFYYFITTELLFALPMPATRNWFMGKMNQFKERRTTTPVKSGFYTTVGRLVPIKQVLKEVKGVKKADLKTVQMSPNK